MRDALQPAVASCFGSGRLDYTKQMHELTRQIRNLTMEQFAARNRNADLIDDQGYGARALQRFV